MNGLRLQLAKSLAAYLLRDSLDKQGVPLMYHCLRVQASCSLLSEDQQIAAILHDCIEDGKLEDPTNKDYWIYSTILKLFGIEVAELVLALTRDPNISYEQYIWILAENLKAAQIKIADLTDNLNEARGPVDSSLRNRYLAAKKYLEDSLGSKKS